MIKLKMIVLRLLMLNLNLKPFKVTTENAALYVRNCLNVGHKLALSGTVSGLINCPISKNLLQKNYGVTEFLAEKCKIKNKSEVMMIKSKNFAVCPVTTHLDIKDITKNIKSSLIVNKVKTIHNWFFKSFKRKPEIGILGLNPHNAELRPGSKEIKEILPAIKKLKNLGHKVKGPLVADTIFLKGYNNYDVIVGMYHDQVLALSKQFINLMP